jgi:xylulokinase
MEQYLLAHDVGTTSDKATLFTTGGRFVASASVEYQTLQPEMTWAEQRPSDWWRAFVSGNRLLMKKSGVSAENILAISFSGQSMGCLPVDSRGKPLRNSIIWMDQRSVEQSNETRKRIGEKVYYNLTGMRISPTFTFSKILWVRDNQPTIYAKTHRFLQAKDYIVMRLTGKFATDYSDASLAGMLDVQRGCWAQRLIDEFDLEDEKLPTIHPAADVIGDINSKVAKEANLAVGTLVVLGGGDGPCAAVGAGVVKPGQCYNYLGASSWIAMSSEKPLMDPKMRIFNQWHLDPRRICPTGTMQAAGASLRWLKDQVCSEEVRKAKRLGVSPYVLMDRAAAQIDPGAKKIIFLPYLMGERSPWWNPNARGAFFGLGLGHRRDHLIRSVLEGVAFNLKIILEVFGELGAQLKEVRLIGGGAKGEVWRQIIADIYGRTILVPEHLEEANSLGAAITAGVGARVYKSFDVAEKLVKIARRNHPDARNSRRYELLFDLFKKLYLGLRPIYQELSTVSV